MNLKIHQLANIRVPPGEVIVAITSHQGALYAITNGGTIFKIEESFL